jgi:hypothetical protein
MYDQEHETIYAEACKLVKRGISVIPVGGGISPKAKEPHHEALKATGHNYINREGAARSTWKALQSRLPTAHELEAWFLEHRARGLGFVTGQLSGWVVVDVDLAGLPLLAELGWTPHVLTPSGGAHFYLRHPGWYVASNASKHKAALPPGFDVRGDGGYVVSPPSRSRKGQYRRTEHRHPLTLEQIPEGVTAAGTQYRLREALGLVRPVVGAQTNEPHREPGHPVQQDARVPVWLMLDRAEPYAVRSRNQGAFLFGLWMNANGYAEAEAVARVEEYVARVRAIKPTPFTVDEARRSVQSAFRYPKNEPWTRREG